MINSMRILVRLVLNWIFSEMISKFSATLSAIGCTSKNVTIFLALGTNVKISSHRHIIFLGQTWVWKPMYIMKFFWHVMQTRVRLSCSDSLIYTGHPTFRRHASPLIWCWQNFSTVPQGIFFSKIIRPNSSSGTPEWSLLSEVRNAQTGWWSMALIHAYICTFFSGIQILFYDFATFWHSLIPYIIYVFLVLALTHIYIHI